VPAVAVSPSIELAVGLGKLLLAFTLQPRPRRIQAAKPMTVFAAASTPEEMTALLVKIARERDRAAFATLFQYYAPRVKTYLMRQGADQASAEDLAQETMLSAWRKADRFDPTKASAGTWIFTVARNLRIDALRKQRRPEFDPADPAFVPEPEAAPDAALHAGQTRVIIRDALKHLPEEQATVIRLSFFEDKPHAEIAEQLALPLGTVKSRLRLAMRRVRDLIGE
jgi:RNA polymerase sigma-70 factor (ECF subfamily)